MNTTDSYFDDKWVAREDHIRRVRVLLDEFPVVAVLGARQVRSPKVYVADPGILHALLGLRLREDVLSHPKVGASWEGFVIGQIMHLMRASPEYPK